MQLISVTHTLDNYTIYKYNISNATNPTVAKMYNKYKLETLDTEPIWAATSSGWTGYASASNLNTPQSLVTGINGSWIVQQIPKSSNQYKSVQWAGIGGIVSQPFNDNNLIQVGTESDSGDGNTNYYAWYELYPKTSEINFGTFCRICVVIPNDKIYAAIYATNVINQWDTIMVDNTQKWEVFLQ